MNDDPSKYINCKREIMFIPERHSVMSWDTIDRMQDEIDSLGMEVSRLKHKVNMCALTGERPEEEPC